MSEAQKINNELHSLSNKLATASNEYSELCRKAAEARSLYDVAKAKSVLKSKHKLASDRAAEATVICEAEMTDARIQEAMRDAMRERLRALESVLNATQTRAGFLRDEMKLAGRDF